MRFSIVYPYPSLIDADSFKEAIKRYVKINRAININQMIITDKMNHVNADLNYYKQNNVDKVGITMYPISSNYMITSNTNGRIPVNSLIPGYRQPFMPVNSLIPGYRQPFMPVIMNIDIPNL